MSSGKQSCFFFPKVYTICFLFLSCTCWNFSIGGWRGAVRGDVLGSHSARGGVQVFTSKCDGSCRLFEDVLIKLRKFCVPGWTGLLFITGLRQLDFVLPWCYFLHVSCAILGSVATNSSFSWLSDTFSTECPGCLWDPSTLDGGNSIFLHCVTSKILFSSQSPNSYFLPNVTKSWPVLHCFLFPQTLRRALLWTSGATFSVHVPSDQAPGPELPSTSAAPHSALFRLYPLNPLL